jgi:formylglycine-generating enzyme required for sulfatase activity
LNALGRGGLLLLAPVVLDAAAGAQPVQKDAPAVTRDSIPGTLVTFEMVAVPGGTAVLPAADGTTRRVGVKPLLVGRTELTWDAYDAFTLSAAPAVNAGGADATARPSRPYGAPDYGFGHAGYPTMSVTRAAAEAFCAWLSEKTGKRYRLPTEAEWVHVATLAAGRATLAPARRDAIAWHQRNAGRKTHPVASRRPDELGLYDLFGNVAEWVTTDDGRRVARGGSYVDPPAVVGPHARAVQDPSWNERDPQIPKSRWWLSDAPFIGFRIVREP